MTIKLLTEQHLEFLRLKGGCQARLSLHMLNATLLEITCLDGETIKWKEVSIHNLCILYIQLN